MKRILIALLLFEPVFAQAAFQVPTTNLTIVVNTGAHNEGLFHFEVQKRAGSVYVPYAEYDLQTVEHTAAQIIQLDLTGSNQFLISQDPDSNFQNIICDYSTTVINPDENIVFFTAEQGSNIVCTFSEKEFSKHPILIIPGSLGTEIKNSDDLLWLDIARNISGNDTFMNPLIFNQNLGPTNPTELIGILRKKSFSLKSYDYSEALIDLLKDGGYTEGQDLFTFPYDWRYGASGVDADSKEVNVEALKGQIDYILNQTDAGKAAGKVDVVAHSTGGLIVKKYVQEHPNDHHIGKAVFVGVPNLGAPKAAKVLLQGDNFGVPGLSDDEMKKLSQNMPVVYDLAPSREYVETNGSYLFSSDRTQSPQFNIHYDFDQSRIFMEGKGANELAMTRAENLHSTEFDDFDLRSVGVDTYSITGCKTPTIDRIEERTYNKNTLQGKKTVTGYFVKSEASGDGTVPYESANSVKTDDDKKFYAISSEHGKLLTTDGVRQQIVNLLTNSELQVNSNVITRQQLLTDSSQCQLGAGKMIMILSPVNISVTDPEGNQLRLAEDGSLQNNIPGADFELWGEQKFVYLPDGPDYKVELQGTGEGEFTLISQNMSDGEMVGSEIAFSDIPVTTNLKGQFIFTESGPQILLDNNGDGNVDETLNPGQYQAPVASNVSGCCSAPAPVEPVQVKVLGATTFKDGTLVLDLADGRTVYLMYHGKKYGFTSDKIFIASGFKFINVISTDLTTIPLGGLLG
jgi:triacylglycerol esterase/lipase EstA (alpha/beta hydrolase family)